MIKVLSRRWKSFWFKVTHWEFWPFAVLYFPVNFYFTWLAIRCRSFFFFTASNPTIDFGGMLGESKAEIFKLIPKQYLPDYTLIDSGNESAALAFGRQIGYPLICKPDVGERGKLVEKIADEAALISYVKKCPVPFLMQELVSYPLELGVFFIKHPGEQLGRITSIVQKDFLHVVGDGNSSIEKLLQESDRAQLQLNFDHPRFQHLLERIPEEGEKFVVENIGNHCRGTTFLNANDQISEPLNRAFNTLVDQIGGLYFGRFDLRCASYESLSNLNHFKILELNGAGAEPGHIYHPGASIWKGYRDIFWHLDQLAQISKANHKQGIPYWSLKRGWKKLRDISKYNKKIEQYI